MSEGFAFFLGRHLCLSCDSLFFFSFLSHVGRFNHLLLLKKGPVWAVGRSFLLLLKLLLWEKSKKINQTKEIYNDINSVQTVSRSAPAPLCPRQKKIRIKKGYI